MPYDSGIFLCRPALPRFAHLLGAYPFCYPFRLFFTVRLPSGRAVILPGEVPISLIAATMQSLTLKMPILFHNLRNRMWFSQKQPAFRTGCRFHIRNENSIEQDWQALWRRVSREFSLSAAIYNDYAFVPCPGTLSRTESSQRFWRCGLPRTRSL
jgi:hypothetical protein